MRWGFKRQRSFMPECGFALTTSGGHLGSTYGEPGRDMVRSFTLTLLRWTWVLRFSWKVNP